MICGRAPAALRQFIARHDELYFNRDAPQISDAEYDRSYGELLELEERHPKLRDANSPTQRVGGAALPTFAPVRHAVPMLSLEKAYSIAEIDRFWHRLADAAAAPGAGLAMPKLDGLAIALHYRGRQLVVGATRGNGQVGEDVTANLRLLHGIPSRLPAAAPDELEVRGEVYMSRTSFAQVNAQLGAAGQKEFVTARNAAAGSLRQKNPQLVRARRLDFQAYWAQRGAAALHPERGAGLPAAGAIRFYGGAALGAGHHAGAVRTICGATAAAARQPRLRHRRRSIADR